MKKKYIYTLDKTTHINDDDYIIIECADATRIISYKDLLNLLNIPELHIDSALSSKSDNPVQNKVIYTQIQTLITRLNEVINNVNNLDIPDAITIDPALSSSSRNPVQNKAVYNKFVELTNYVNSLNDTIQNLDIPDGLLVDDTLNEESTNPVQNKVIYTTINDLQTAFNELSGSIPEGITVDTELNETSNNAIANSSVYEAINSITTTINDLNIPAIDTELSFDSNNPVANAIIANAIQAINDTLDTIKIDSDLSKDSENAIMNKTVATKIEEITTNIETILTALDEPMPEADTANSLALGSDYKANFKKLYSDTVNINNKLKYSFANINTANAPIEGNMLVLDLGFNDYKTHASIALDLANNTIYSITCNNETFSSWAKLVTKNNIAEEISKVLLGRLTLQQILALGPIYLPITVTSQGDVISNATIVANDNFTDFAHLLDIDEEGSTAFLSTLEAMALDLSLTQSNVESVKNATIRMARFGSYVYLYPIDNARWDNLYYLGNPNSKFETAYLNVPPLVEGDNAFYTNISYIGKESTNEATKFTDEQVINFINQLKPMVFNKNYGSKRNHHGFSGQDLDNALTSLGISHAVLNKIKVGSSNLYNISYEDLISDLTRFCQIQYNEIQDLKTKMTQKDQEIADLRTEIANIKAFINM